MDEIRRVLDDLEEKIIQQPYVFHNTCAIVNDNITREAVIEEYNQHIGLHPFGYHITNKSGCLVCVFVWDPTA